MDVRLKCLNYLFLFEQEKERIKHLIINCLNTFSAFDPSIGLPFEDENVAKLLEKIVSVDFEMPKTFSKNLKGRDC